MEFLRQFYNLVREHRNLILGSVACGLLFALANLVPPLLIRQLIQWVTEGGGSTGDLVQLTLLLLVA